MKRHELLDHLRWHGCAVAREGGRHTIFWNPANGAKAPVPRHGEIDNRLARKICGQLGIPPIR
ncbi:MAG TPA: addiction module toxin, HicA family [Solibacterales bacterium]|nr:addiction module toxin, HicA family [Bryobacterales bacterium]